MPFVKLDCGMLNSTLWFERTAREIFITSLLMAEPYETIEPLPQIEINTLNLTGWSVPPGWYGFIPAASVGIIHRSRLEFNDETRAALSSLGDPDVSSRSKDFDGRRLVRVDGGFIVLNFIKYRDKDATTADRSRRWRERQKLKQSVNTNHAVSNTQTRVIRHQAEAEAEAIKKEIGGNSNSVAMKPRGPAPLSARGEHRNHACCGRVCLQSSQFDTFIRAAANQPDPDAYVRDFFRVWHARYMDGDRKGEIIADDSFPFWRARWAETHPTEKGRKKSDNDELDKSIARQKSEAAKGEARRKSIGL